MNTFGSTRNSKMFFNLFTSCIKCFRFSRPGTGIFSGAKVIWVEPPPKSREAKLFLSDPGDKRSRRKLTVNQP